MSCRRPTRNPKWIVGFLLPVLLGADTQAGQGLQARATLEADTVAIHVGDQLRVQLSVEHPAGFEVVLPDSAAPLDLRPFEIIALEERGRTETDGVARTEIDLILTAWELGELEIPSIDVHLVGNGDTLVVATNALSIGVETVGLDEGGDIREIADPIGIPRNWLLSWPWVLGALLMGGGALLAWRRWRSRPDVVDLECPLPLQPPEETALAALAAIEASSLLSDRRVRRFHIEVSEVFRSYLEGRYRIWALQMTTPDTVEALGKEDLERGVRLDILGLLDACDMVKFAKFRPDIPTCRGTLELARSLIRLTTAIEEERVAEEAKAAEEVMSAEGEQLSVEESSSEAMA